MSGLCEETLGMQTEAEHSEKTLPAVKQLPQPLCAKLGSGFSRSPNAVRTFLPALSVSNGHQSADCPLRAVPTAAASTARSGLQWVP